MGMERVLFLGEEKAPISSRATFSKCIAAAWTRTQKNLFTQRALYFSPTKALLRLCTNINAIGRL